MEVSDNNALLDGKCSPVACMAFNGGQRFASPPDHAMAASSEIRPCEMCK